MIDTMNEITQFSSFSGKLVLEEVKGVINGRMEPENDVTAREGSDRDMYVYVPMSGCLDAKQGQVIMILRDSSDEQSACEIMKNYGLDELAEKKHFLLLFPNPLESGWNYTASLEYEDDIAYLVRCFSSLSTSKGGVSGFNGMIFYISASKASSAMLMTLSAKSPINAAGIMISEFPEDYKIPEDALNMPQVTYICGKNFLAEEYLKKANNVKESDRMAYCHVIAYTNIVNRNIRHMISQKKISSEEIEFAWDTLFSETRRWQNDTYGTYQKRTNFTERGFIAHVKDTSLGVNDGFAHTWYEYIPPQLRGSKEKVPLLFYFHGIGCVPLYGAEQSGWHDIADRENFIVVYPKPAIEKRWNIWNVKKLPSDESFVLALIEHMKKQYPIDETRIYISGFSMGGMMTNAMACSHPELFAAASPCNGYNIGYTGTIKDWAPFLLKMNPKSIVMTAIENSAEKESQTRILADQKKVEKDYRMPIIQSSGLLDGKWPIPAADDDRIKTFDYWKAYNNIPITPYFIDLQYESGLAAEETFYEGSDERFLHHKWFSRDLGSISLYEILLAKRMPHALDLRQLEIAWNFMKKFSRNSDGSLNIAE